MQGLDRDNLRPIDVWKALDDATRQLAAQSMYEGGGSSRDEADLAICQALRFRESAVRKLPVQRRVAYLLKQVPMDDGMVSSLLISLHTKHRSEILSGLLDELGIPHEEGLIDDEYEMTAPPAEKLAEACTNLYGRFPHEYVQTYLASLLAMDRETWGGVAPHLDPPA